MSQGLAVRSALAILVSLSNTAFVAAIVALLWYYVWSRATGADWLLVYALPVVVVGLVLLPLRLRFKLGSDGIVVTNLFVRDTTAWSDVAEVTARRLSTMALMGLDFSAPGVVVVKESGLPVQAYATWGLRRPARQRLALALEAAAHEHGFRNGVTADALRFRGGPDEPEPSADDVPPSWDGSEVECVFCGRRGTVDEMQPLDAGSGAWHCADPYGCSRR